MNDYLVVALGFGAWVVIGLILEWRLQLRKKVKQFFGQEDG